MNEAARPTLIARHLTKKIGRRVIVDDVSFDIAPGEVFGFLGPNGAGKTTTIRMLVGLIRPTAGKVTICGYDIVKQFEQATRCVGCIVENPDLYRFMTGRENLEHFSRMLGIRDPSEIERAADLVDLGPRLDDRVRTYSLGMRQRLGIAQALLGEPRILILDEPANGLDPAGIREIRELLRMLARDRGLSVFISSHLLAEIELICDRVAIIHRGRILRDGAVADLLAEKMETELRVNDTARAEAVLEDLGFAFRHDDGAILLSGGEGREAEIVRALVERGISVHRIQPKIATLEEMFLQATGGETVGA